MHLLSTTNPLSKSEGNVSVAIFSYKEKRKFLRVSEDYEDTVKRISKAFDIKNAVLSLHTTSLDACKGVSVEIDESAYPLMWTVLDEITVTAGERPVVAVITQAAPEPRKNAEASGSLPTPRNTPPTEEKAEKSNAGADTGRGSVSPPPAGSPAIEVSRNDVEDYDKFDFEEHELEGIDEDQEREALLYAQEKEREKKERDEREKKQKEEAVEKKQSDKKEKEKEKASALPSNFQDQPSVGEGSFTPNKFKPVRNQSQAVKDSGSSGVQVKKEKIDEVKGASHDALPKASKSARKEVADAEDADPRFEISILGPPPNNLTAQFKTRGKHPVRKVLAAACKAFKVDYSQCRLYLEVVTDENGQRQVDQFECHEDETMMQCGVNSESCLYVRVDRSDDEDEDEDELSGADEE